MKNKISNTINTFHAFIRIGSGRKLIIFDFIILVVIFYDLVVIKNLNLDIYHFSFAQNIWNNFGIKYSLISILIIYFPPIVSAFINFLFRDAKVFKKGIPTKYKNLFFIFHFFIAISFACFISISSELQQLSGFKVNDWKLGNFSLSTYEYTPIYYYIIAGITTTTAIWLIFKLFGSIFFSKSNFIEEYKLWFNLADISREYFPKQKANLIFVNNASMAPTINWVNKKEEYYRNSYQNKVPTSDDARKYLTTAAEKCRDFIRQYLFQDSSNKSDFSIEFLPGTSRALEVGLSQINNLDRIILTPYEHPSQYNVVEWFSFIKPNIKHELLSMDYSILDKDWITQRDWLINLIKSKLPEDTNKKVAILISEVHYISGLYINTKEIIEILRPDYRNSNIVFIIDGSQAVGNLLKPFNNLITCIHGEDFYYFSAHKWLLSPNTCGVLVAEQNRTRYSVNPYDLFGKRLPTATIEPGVIFGLYSSLQFLLANNMLHLNRFNEKSRLLKKYFKENIGDQLEIIESLSDEMNLSNFIAVKPSNGHKWKDENMIVFWKEITRSGSDLTLIDLTESPEQTWWVRISFPYFLQLHLLKQLIKHLNNRVTTVN